MAFMPMMPGQGMVGGPQAGPASGAMPPSSMAPAQSPAQPGMDLMALLGGQPSPDSDPMALSAATANALRQFEMLETMVIDLARSFPGAEDAARQILEGVQRWRQMVVVATAPAPQGMPGAGMMM
jgi:hypothetical protein